MFTSCSLHWGSLNQDRCPVNFRNGQIKTTKSQNGSYALPWSPESITKPRLSTGSEFCIFNRFPRGNYLVWWVMVRVRVSLGVRVRGRVRVNNLLGSR